MKLTNILRALGLILMAFGTILAAPLAVALMEGDSRASLAFGVGLAGAVGCGLALPFVRGGWQF